MQGKEEIFSFLARIDTGIDDADATDLCRMALCILELHSEVSGVSSGGGWADGAHARHVTHPEVLGV